MEISIVEQSLSLIRFFFVGIYFALIYDAIKLFRRIFLPSYTEKFLEKYKAKLAVKRQSRLYCSIISFIFDMLFFLIIIPQMCIFVYAFCNGIIRWYIYVATAIGFFAFKLTVGRLNNLMIQYICLLTYVLICRISLLVGRVLDKIKAKTAKIKIKRRTKEKKKYLIGFGGK